MVRNGINIQDESRFHENSKLIGNNEFNYYLMVRWNELAMKY